MTIRLSRCCQLVLASAFAYLRTQAQPGTVLWTYQAPNFILSSPALANDGTVYIGAGALLAVTNSGSMASNRWTLPVTPSLCPAVGVDGTIYCANGSLFAVGPDGVVKWSYQGQGGGSGAPAIGSDNTIYFFGGGRLYAVLPSGIKKWDYLIGSGGYIDTPFSPVIAPDGRIYVAAGTAGTLCAFSPEGTNEWCADLRSNGAGATSPALGADGTIYYPLGYLSAFSPNGTNLWTAGDQFHTSPAVGTGGTIYIADGARALNALTSGGQPIWNLLASAAPLGATVPAVDADGRTYYCTSNSIWAVSSQGQVLWKMTQPGDPGPGGDFALTSPIIGPDGTLYAALGNTLYAIATGTNGPANSPWPMYQQNARHTGKVEKPLLKQPQKRSDANFEFQLYPQQLGLAYTVESSSNLYNWTSLTSFVASTLPTDVVDLTASNAPARFYRAFSGP
jgi:PQQ-like domain